MSTFLLLLVLFFAATVIADIRNAGIVPARVIIFALTVDAALLLSSFYFYITALGA